MAVPKQKLSKARTNKRASANNKIDASTVVLCTKCAEPVRAHFACKKCGNYDGKRSVPVKTKKEESK